MNGQPDSGPAGGIAVRRRVPADVDRCVDLLRQVRAADGYPARWPVDPRRWLLAPTELAAWVAGDGGGLVGHVALHRAEDEPALDAWCRATGRGPESLAVVARLFVSPLHRGRGLGSGLVEAAVRFAELRGLVPVLEVLELDRRAIALYGRSGWSLVGTRHVVAPDGRRLAVHAYVASAWTC